jgi:predicted dehydrogenase
MPKTVVMVGCGAMARGWLKAIAETPDLKSRISIVGFVDLGGKAAENLALEFGFTGAATGTNLDDMLAKTRPDLLFDIVPPAFRLEVVLAGLRGGCHVLSEKPMATSLTDAQRLIEASAQFGRIHAIIQNRRFDPQVRRIRDFISSGAIGDLTGIHCDFFVGAHFGGFREKMQHVLLLDMAIHTFDAARFMSGREPLAVYCHETNPRGSWYAHGAAANAIFEFSDEVVFTYRGSWCAEGANTTWESAWRMVATHGTLLWDGGTKIEVGRAKGGSGLLRDVEPMRVPETSDPAMTGGHASVIRDFMASIDAGRKPETVGSDNINSLAMVFAAINSARKRRRVKVRP